MMSGSSSQSFVSIYEALHFILVLWQVSLMACYEIAFYDLIGFFFYSVASCYTEKRIKLNHQHKN